MKIAACVHTPITDPHAFEPCDTCSGCHFCGVPEDEHEGVT